MWYNTSMGRNLLMRWNPMVFPISISSLTAGLNLNLTSFLFIIVFFLFFMVLSLINCFTYIVSFYIYQPCHQGHCLQQQLLILRCLLNQSWINVNTKQAFCMRIHIQYIGSWLFLKEGFVFIREVGNKTKVGKYLITLLQCNFVWTNAAWDTTLYQKRWRKFANFSPQVWVFDLNLGQKRI